MSCALEVLSRAGSMLLLFDSHSSLFDFQAAVGFLCSGFPYMLMQEHRGFLRRSWCGRVWADCSRARLDQKALPPTRHWEGTSLHQRHLKACQPVYQPFLSGSAGSLGHLSFTSFSGPTSVDMSETESKTGYKLMKVYCNWPLPCDKAIGTHGCQNFLSGSFPPGPIPFPFPTLCNCSWMEFGPMHKTKMWWKLILGSHLWWPGVGDLGKFSRPVLTKCDRLPIPTSGSQPQLWHISTAGSLTTRSDATVCMIPDISPGKMGSMCINAE